MTSSGLVSQAEIVENRTSQIGEKGTFGVGVDTSGPWTLKEQLLWVRTFDTVEELRQALLEFKAQFNGHWLLPRHGYATPTKVRAAHTPVAEVA